MKKIPTSIFTARVTISDKRWLRHGGWRRFATTVVRACLAQHGLTTPAVVNINFISDAAMLIINQRFRDQAKATNVLSFPSGMLSAPPLVPQLDLGDVLVAYETVSAEAPRYRRPLRDYVAHMLTHGTLHLLGYDHVRQRDHQVMLRLEARVLAKLGLASPYTLTQNKPL